MKHKKVRDYFERNLLSILLGLNVNRRNQNRAPLVSRIIIYFLESFYAFFLCLCFV